MKRYVTLLLAAVVGAAAAPAAGKPAAKPASPQAQPGKAKPSTKAPGRKKPATDAARKLPGSSLSLAEALRDGYAFVTVCHATAEAKVWGRPQGAEQTFARVETLLAGKIAKDKTLRVSYFLVDVGGRREQPIKKGQRIIWIIRKRGRSCLGVKAVLDTPANREAVAAAVKEANEEIEAAINALVAALRLQTPKGWQVTLTKGEVEPKGLSKAEGVSISMEPKVTGPGKPKGTHLWLMSSTYQIPQQIPFLHHVARAGQGEALTKTAQMAFWRGRRVLYRSADAKMPSEAIWAALNATARVPGAIDVRRRKAGSYVAGKWKYVLERRRFSSHGALLYMGIPIHADFDRLVRTPWGYMQNSPPLRTMRGPSGWLPLGDSGRFGFRARDEFVISFGQTKIDAKAARLYVSGPWAYSSGSLTCGGKAVPTPKNVGDYYVTPWGKIFWTGRRALWAIGHKGKAGKELPPPALLLQALEPQRKKWQKPAAGKDSAKPAVKWGKAVNGLVCGISAFKPKVQLGVPYEIEVSVKNTSKGDILLLKRRFFNKEPLNDHVYFMQPCKTYRELFTHDEKLLAIGPVRRQDFLLLKPNDIYKFTHRTLVYTPSIRKNLKNIEADLGLMDVTHEGTYLMQVWYTPWAHPVAKGVDLGGLKPWKGVLLSAPVEVVVAKPVVAGRKAP